jgi:hypothetical protein
MEMKNACHILMVNFIVQQSLELLRNNFRAKMMKIQIEVPEYFISFLKLYLQIFGHLKNLK